MAGELNEEVVDDKKKKKRADKKLDKKDKKKKGKAGGADDLDGEEETFGGKVITFFVTIIIFLIWMAIIILLVKWDVGGFGSGVLAPVIKDVPYLNQILPDDVLEEISTEDDTYAYQSLEDAIARIKELEVELVEAQNATNENAGYIAELEQKAAELEQYKKEEAAFEALKAEWYEEVVFAEEAPEVEYYQQFYETIEPANAEVLYKQVVEQTLYDNEVEDYVATYSSMKPKQAAEIFNTMTDDLDLVADILLNMDAESRGSILGQMEAETAAKVTEIMEP